MFPVGDQNIPGRGLAGVTLTLLAINVAVFVLLQLPSDTFTSSFSTVPAEIMGRCPPGSSVPSAFGACDITRPVRIDLGGQIVPLDHRPGPDPIYLTLLSSTFMHGGWLHLLGNMLFLFIFGDNVEHVVGRVVYLALYLATGLVGSAAHVLSGPDSVIPSLGASGAISGVLGAYLVMFPGNLVTVFMFRLLMQVPAIVAIGLWAALQFFNGIVGFGEEGGGVAYMAHIGGFVAGVIGGLLLRNAVGGSTTARRYA